MNVNVEKYMRTEIKSQLASCNEKRQQMFKRMYSHDDLTKSIDEVVDSMPVEKLDLALTQVERTLNS